PPAALVVQSLENSKYEYQVIAHLESGETLQSERAPIRIELSAPVPKNPSNRAIVDHEEEALLTWEKTSLTDEYLLQISTHRSFQEAEEFRSRDNFFLFTGEPAKTYYWRVKSLTGSKSSEWSEVFEFQVK